jgi:NTE family protein
MRTRIAIACQGGGSQTAFTAGVLVGLHEAGALEEFEVTGLSGTSGGAVCASLVWYAARRREPLTDRLMAFWHDNTAQTFVECVSNDLTVRWLRMVNKGMLPTVAIAPGSPVMQAMTDYANFASFASGQRREFIDFAALLRRHIDFDEIMRWGPQPTAPVLVIGACSVLSGRLAKFISARQPIKIEHILGSCAVPNLFTAVESEGDAYWDGLFSDNPPMDSLVRPSLVGDANIPREIWVIKVNPTRRDSVPLEADDVTDRRNQLEGNVALFQNLKYLELLNDLLAHGAFRNGAFKDFFSEPVRIPRAFREDPAKPYHIPWIEMSEDMQQTLDYEGKLDRSHTNIEGLIAEGKAQARRFLAARKAAVNASGS